jgi:hypothetical protein
MIPAPNTAPPTKRRKVSIEIYFVLYLSAIVLLLGTGTKSKHQDPDTLLKTIRDFVVHFDVNVEKVALVYTMLPAGLETLPASEQLRRDSVNVVKAWGSVSDVRFEITGIRDTLTGQMLPVESASLQNEGPMAAVVKWRPNGPLQNRVYSITVAASAEPEVPATVPLESRDRIEKALRSEGRVRDTVTFTVSVFAVTSASQIHQAIAAQQKIPDTPSTPSVLATAPTPGSATFGGEPFAMDLKQDQVFIASGQRWTNTVYFSGVRNVGADVTLRVEPESVERIAASNGTVTLAGKATGDQKITVTATRADGLTSQRTFMVATGRLDAPSIPGTLFAGETYRYDFRSDDVDPATIAVRVLENNKVVLTGGAMISYTPRLTGSVVFERLLNGSVYDRQEATIAALPYPAFTDWKAEDRDHAIITTKSYGTVGGQVNKAVLKILDGNAADDPEEISYVDDPVTKAHIQKWRVWRQSPDKEFSVVAWVMDQRGSASAKKQRINFD